MGNLSGSHLFVVVVVMLALFGGNRIAEIGRGLGEGIRNFKKGLAEDADDEDSPRQLAAHPRDASRQQPSVGRNAQGTGADDDGEST